MTYFLTNMRFSFDKLILAFFRSLFLLASVGFCLFVRDKQIEAQSRVSKVAKLGPIVRVGKDTLVSRDGDVPHVELSSAADLSNFDALGVSSIVWGEREKAWTTRVYFSGDNGKNWRSVTPWDQALIATLDPQIAFTTSHTMSFFALRFSGEMLGYWTSDYGKHWGHAAGLQSGDHEVVAVDKKSDLFHGRAYICIMGDRNLQVYRSTDEGRTFSGPVVAVEGADGLDVNTMGNILVLRDGRLVLPYFDFRVLGPGQVGSENNLWTATSKDGGATFAAPRKVTRIVSSQNSNYRRFLSGFSPAAVDISERFPDRMYIAWPEEREGTLRVVLTSSADTGESWSIRKPVDPGVADSTLQFQPTLAVNGNGILGVTWYDTRVSSDGSRYDVYFSASLDGGATFSPPTKLSSASSRFPGKGNEERRPGPGAQFKSASERWPTGGDYVTTTTDARGHFHVFWTDSRSGTFQVRTADVEVLP